MSINRIGQGVPAGELAASAIVTPAGQSLDLRQFVWGGPSAIALVKRAIEILGDDLRGRRLLDVGYGHGQMSCLFALLGAQVVAVDTHDVARDEAVSEAKRWGVSNRIEFAVYSGDPNDIKQTQFDVTFTKSVLLLIPKLEVFLRALSMKLSANGEVIFIENGFHNPLSVLGRRILHRLKKNQDGYYPGVRMYGWDRPAYLSAARINIMREVFDVRGVLRAPSPHWYLIHGLKRAD